MDVNRFELAGTLLARPKLHEERDWAAMLYIVTHLRGPERSEGNEVLVRDPSPEFVDKLQATKIGARVSVTGRIQRRWIHFDGDAFHAMHGYMDLIAEEKDVAFL